jgi:hypothetical protein
MKNLDLITLKKLALAKSVEGKARDVEQSRYNKNEFSLDGSDYLVLTDSEADEACAEHVKNSLWAFNADFILSEAGLDSSYSTAKSLTELQGNSCENCNDLILAIIEGTCGLDSFVQSAMIADGRGHFLATYDGDELEQDICKQTFYIYKTN